ncbi:trypsin II-P29-like [Centruroides vittatus]|uniref:trypsin II-P29-like n=1 Tax=Centruroides vittatus TaxID=120091 RepID=UPI00350F6FFE
MRFWTRMIFFLFVLTSSFYFAFAEGISSYESDNRPICLTDMDFSNIKNRIVGGSDADKDSFRFAAGLITSSSFPGRIRTDQAACAGTLITEKHVMTASHCLYGKEHLRSTMRLNIGDYDTYVTNEARNYIRGVKSIHMHPRYVDETFNNDICILELDKPVPLERSSDLRAAILPPQDSSLSPGTICTVWGWGRLSYEGGRPHILQQVDVPITSREDCQRHLAHEITSNMICAGGEEGKDACLGDSGGSLLVQAENYYIASGIVSFGKNCALPGVSGVYTDVSRYTDWIYEMTRNADCKPRIFPREKYPH